MFCCTSIIRRIDVLLFALTMFYLLFSVSVLRAEDSTGGQISFVKYDTSARRTDICMVDSDGKNLVNITESRNIRGTANAYSWSPDGTSMAISFSENNGVYRLNMGQLSLEEMNPDGYDPSWSPQGNTIVYTSMRDGNAEIYCMPGIINLTRNSKNDSSPSWMPDGRIVFLSDRTVTGRFRDYVMDPDGGNVEEFELSLGTEILNTRNGFMFFSWSRDGKNLVRMGSISVNNENPKFGFIIQDLETGEERLAPFHSEQLAGSSQNEHISMPVLSPDGTKIAFVSDRNSSSVNNQTVSVYDLYVINTDGTGRIQLTANKHEELVGRERSIDRVAWRPSTSSVLVNDKSGVAPSVFILDPVYPNPFNPSTTISFTLSAPGKAQLTVFSVTGQKVRELISGQLSGGRHTATWDGCNDSGKAVSSGVYIVRLETGDRAEMRKMLLAR